MTATATGIDTRDMLLIHRVIRRETGSLPGLLQADEAERQRFLRQVPPPARLASSLVGRRQRARESAAIHGGRARAA
jgi:hypothetical protein